MCIYDIFICCKSEDYGLARNVYKFLVDRGFRVFLADAELRKKANAEYGKVIDKALDSAKHFILVASRKEFVESSYVESEWRTFLEEQRTGRKQGNILTILKEIEVSSLPISLRKFQSFQYSSYFNIIYYLRNPAHGNQLNDKTELDIHPSSQTISKKSFIDSIFLHILFIILFIILLYLIFIKPELNNRMNKEDVNTVFIHLKNNITGDIGTNIEYIEMTNEYREHIKENEKEMYLNALYKAYKKDSISPSDLYKKKISNHPTIGKIISEKEFCDFAIVEH